MSDEFGDDRIVTDQTFAPMSLQDDDCPDSCTAHISCVIEHVENPLQLLDDMITIAEWEVTGKPQPGDKEQAMIYRHARDQLLLRPSDPVVWSIIRWVLVGESEEDINKAASVIKEERNEHPRTGAVT